MVPSGTASQSNRRRAAASRDVGSVGQTRSMTTDASHDSAVEALRAARLRAQGLVTPFGSPADAIERLVCVQAQDLAAAKWVLGARVRDSSEASIDAAIEGRLLLRSWPMRGTLHFVDPVMLRPILRLASPRVRMRSAKMERDEGIDEQVLATVRGIAVALLEGGRSATRDELQAAWSAAGVSTTGQRGYHLIWLLASEGLLCNGPIETRARQRFVLLDEWSPAGASDLGDDEALARLFAGYARGHGPVSARDFAWWTGLTLTQARTAVDLAGGAVTAWDDERFVAADAPSTGRSASGHHVLAPFDEYFLGYGDRSAFCSPDDALRVVPGKNGLFLPILVRDGEVVGTWRRSPERRAGTTVTLAPFLAGCELDGFRPALDRWAAFWSARLAGVEVEPTEVGPTA